MSADNGIYILKCKDQYRVTHAQAIDNLYWSYLSNLPNPELVPTRVYELYRNCKFTRKKTMALFIASKMLEDLDICEFGINIIRYPGSWEQLVDAAKELAPRELESIGDRDCNENSYAALVELTMDEFSDDADLASVTQYAANVAYAKSAD